MKLYTWSRIAEEQVTPLATRQIVHTDTMTLVRRRLLKGSTLQLHRHVEEQVSMIDHGKVRFVVCGEEQIVTSGEALAIPSNAPHSVEALEDSVVLDVFPKPSTKELTE